MVLLWENVYFQLTCLSLDKFKLWGQEILVHSFLPVCSTVFCHSVSSLSRSAMLHSAKIILGIILQQPVIDYYYASVRKLRWSGFSEYSCKIQITREHENPLITPSQAAVHESLPFDRKQWGACLSHTISLSNLQVLVTLLLIHRVSLQERAWG